MAAGKTNQKYVEHRPEGESGQPNPQRRRSEHGAAAQAGGAGRLGANSGSGPGSGALQWPARLAAELGLSLVVHNDVGVGLLLAGVLDLALVLVAAGAAEGAAELVVVELERQGAVARSLVGAAQDVHPERALHACEGAGCAAVRPCLCVRRALGRGRRGRACYMYNRPAVATTDRRRFSSSSCAPWPCSVFCATPEE